MEAPDWHSDEWCARLRQGDSAAFEALVREFEAPLRRFAYRFLRSREGSAELVQEVFLRLWQGRERLRLRNGVRAYLFQAARNRALDQLARQRVSRRWVTRSLDDSAMEVAADAPPAEERLDRADRVEVLRALLAAMPARRRAVCELRWLHGLRPVEIAARLNIAEKTVEAQITRGLRQLRGAVVPDSPTIAQPSDGTAGSELA